MRTFLIILLTALLTLIGGGIAMQEGLIGGLAGTGGASECKQTQIVKKYEGADCPIKETGNSCTTPRGTTVDHGSAVLSFESQSSSVEEGCISKTSICNNGSYLNDDTPHENETCTLDSPERCEVNGFVMAHGTSVTFYSAGVEQNGERVCDSQERSCSDGTTTGDDEFKYVSCHGGTTACEAVECNCEEEPVVAPAPKPKPVTVKPAVKQPVAKTVISSVPTSKEPNCPNPFGGYRWEPGQTGTAYKSSSVSYGQSCEAVSIVCAYGSIRYGTKANPGGIAGGLSKSCSVLPADPCNSACGTVPNGQTVTTYQQAIIPHGNGKTCNDTKIVSTCNNGSLSPIGGSSCSCEIAPPSPCVAPNGQSVAHNNSITLYQFPQVQALPGDGSDTCVRQWRQCINGGWHDWNGNAASFTFQYATCEVIPPPAGGGPGGEGVPTQ